MAFASQAGFRRTRFGAVGVLGALCLTWLATTPLGASAAVDPGQGTAIAITNRFDPRAGALSLGITFGIAIAGHTNEAAKGQSQAVNLGTIGTTLGNVQCDGKPPTLPSDKQPQALIVETGDPGAAQGKNEADIGGAYNKFARAGDGPIGEAITTTAPISLAGVISIGGGIARSYSGVVNGERESGATVDLSGITLPGGIGLSGLHWGVIYRSTGDNRQEGTFSIGHATIAGVPIPTNNPAATMATLGAVLDPLGFQLNPPTTHRTAGILIVDPLGISIVPNATRDSITGTIINGIQPIRGPLIDAVLKANCELGGPLTVVEAVVGDISGAGAFHLTMGGVQATSGIVPANNFDLSLPANLPPPPPSSFGIPAQAPTADQPGLPGTTGSTFGATTPSNSTSAGTTPSAATAPTASATPPPNVASNRLASAGPVKVLHGKRGGALAIVGLGGLASLAALAEGDRRKMRRAQRPTSRFEE